VKGCKGSGFVFKKKSLPIVPGRRWARKEGKGHGIIEGREVVSGNHYLNSAHPELRAVLTRKIRRQTKKKD